MHPFLIALPVAVLVIGPIFFLPTANSAPFRAPQEFLLILVAWCVIAALTPKSLRLLIQSERLRGISGWIAAIFGWLVVTSMFAAHGSAWHYAASLATFLLLGLCLATWLDAREMRRRYLVALLGVVSALEVSLVAAQAATLPLEVWWKPLTGHGLAWLDGFVSVVGKGAALGVSAGTFGNVNYLAEMLVLLIPVVWAFGWSSLRQPGRIGVSICALGALSLLPLSGARAALGGVVMAAPMAWLCASGVIEKHIVARRARQGWWRLGPFVSGLSVTLVACATVAVAYLPLPADRALASRFIQWRAAGDLWLAHPIQGIGLGGYKFTNIAHLRALYPEGLPAAVPLERFMQAHSEPLQLLVELGLVGAMLIGAAMWQWVRVVRCNPSLSLWQQIGIFWGVGALALASLTGFPLHIPFTALLLTVVMAIGLADTTARDVPAPAWSIGKSAGVSGAVAALGMFIIVLSAWPEYRAHQLEYQAKHESQRGKWAEAFALYTEADRHMRFRGRLRWHELQMLVQQSKFGDAIALYDTSAGEGLGLDAEYWYGRALEGRGRQAEARVAYERMIHYFPRGHALHLAATKRLGQLPKAR